MNVTIDYPSWLLAVTAVFGVAWIVQMLLQVIVWMAPLRKARKARGTASAARPTTDQPSVTVLVYSRNAAKALARNLPILLTQDYPDYEVMVLDDDSCDDTSDVLSMMDQRYAKLFHSRIDKRARAMSHRKLAVLLGAKASHDDIILMTHAECQPVSADWISGMVRHFSNPAVEVVLGPVVYERHMSFVSRFCEFDLFRRLLLLFGITLSCRPFAGWGQNLAFRKRTFYANRSQGFQRHLKMQPGEDDLFVADVAHGNNVAVEMGADSLVTDQSQPLFDAWSVDRLNRGFTSRLYAMTPALVRGIDSITRYLTVLPGLVLAGYALYVLLQPGTHHAAIAALATALVMLLARIALMTYTSIATARVLRQRPMLGWPILCDLYMPLVDIWYRCKALVHSKSFEVSRIGLM